MNITIAKSIRQLLATLVLAALSACGGGGGGSSNGILGVSLTDSPACGFDAVNVTVSKFRVHINAAASDSSAGWSEITLNPPRKINLLDLTNGLLEDLGETPLPAGHYTQMRLVLEANTGSNPLANSVIPTGLVETALKTPSGTQSGIKLVNPFTVASGQRSDLVLDFDACKSVVRNGNGNYLLKPVIKIVPNTANGIEGFVDPSLTAGDNVVVSAQVNGTVVESTVPASGKFFLSRLAPGKYDVVVSANGHATAVITGVPVDDAISVVTLSTSTAPIVLPTSAVSHSISGTVLLNPVNADQAIFVAAKQDVLPATILVPPITVTVRAQSADLATGAYSLLLPAGAPLLGQFGALPIALNAQNDPAGKYVIEASATGYATQTSVEKNVSTSDQPNVNFILVP